MIFEKNGINRGTRINIPAIREMIAARFSFSISEVTKKVKKNRNINTPAIDRKICMMERQLCCDKDNESVPDYQIGNWYVLYLAIYS